MRVVLIGGTGARALIPGDAEVAEAAVTPWGAVAGPVHRWRRGGAEVFFIHRHGPTGAIAPHRVNYRANVWAARELAPTAVVGINAVGGIAAAAAPGTIVVPHQLIDYTSGREHSYFDGTRAPLRHVEFDPPFSTAVRDALLAAAARAGVATLAAATYGVTQGPRLETAAEIDRLEGDGCDVVGMTAMPEAILAREADLAYALCALVVNRAAGRLPPGGTIHAEMPAFLESGMRRVGALLEAWLRGGDTLHRPA